MKLTPLKVLSWKSLNNWRNSGDVHVDPAAVIFRAEFERVVDFGLELQIVRRGRSLPQPTATAVVQTATIAVDRARKRRAVEVEPARLVAARIAGVGQHLVGRLEAEHRGARELALLLLSSIRRVEPPARRIDAWEQLQAGDSRAGRYCRQVGVGRAQRVARADGQLAGNVDAVERRRSSFLRLAACSAAPSVSLRPSVIWKMLCVNRPRSCWLLVLSSNRSPVSVCVASSRRVDRAWRSGAAR